jgi:TonB family protein
MRLWLYTSAKTSSLGPVTTSVVAHAILIGAAVHGTAVNARELKEAIAQRVFYMPPPDRRISSKADVEHLQYIEVGFGDAVEESSDASAKKSRPGGETPLPRQGGDLGYDDRAQAAALAAPSDDSVYSVLDVEESAVRAEGSAAPVYPADLVKASVEGSVLTRYIVDTTGYADPASIQVIRSTHPAFVASVLEALPRMRFSAASVSGRRVRQIVEQNFEFKITPPTAAPAEHTQAKPIP